MSGESSGPERRPVGHEHRPDGAARPHRARAPRIRGRAANGITFRQEASGSYSVDDFPPLWDLSPTALGELSAGLVTTTITVRTRTRSAVYQLIGYGPTKTRTLRAKRLYVVTYGDEGA